VSAPAAAGGPEAASLSFTVFASDPDGAAIASLTASPLPPGATFAPVESMASGVFGWTPTHDQAGVYNVTFTATNTLSGQATTPITVSNVDRPPSLAAPLEVAGVAGSLVTAGVSASDPDGDAIDSLSMDLDALPPGNDAQFTTDAANTTGTFTWNAASADTGAYALPVRAVNALVTTAIVTLHIASPLALQVASYASGTVGVAFEIVATALHTDTTKTLTITAGGAPASLAFSHTPGISPATATLSGVLTEADAVGSPHTIAWQVDDGAGGTATATTALHVSTVTAVSAEEVPTGAPRVLSLRSRPNPFQTTTQIDLRVAGRAPAGRWALRLYDLNGRLVRTLLEGAPWRSTIVRWDGVTESGARAAAGVYYYRLEGPNLRLGRRLLLLK